jgi:beta-alanine degradation protein BauB
VEREAWMEGKGAQGEERGTYAIEEFAQELEVAPMNREIGTSLWFENDHVRVFEIRLEPGQRGPFHVHDATYFWTVVEPGRGLQRFVDGTLIVRDYALGETKYLVNSPEDPLVHDLENVGDSTLRFVTVEVKH